MPITNQQLKESKVPFVIDEEGFRWEWCELCKTAYVRCSKCNNNCCNGGTGDIEGQRCGCEEAYVHQHKYWAEKLDPSKEKFFDENGKEKNNQIL